MREGVMDEHLGGERLEAERLDAEELSPEAAWRREREARWRAEAALARERALRQAMEAESASGAPTGRAAESPERVGHWRYDLRSGQLSRDPSLRRILGLPPEPDERERAEWRRLVHPEDLPLLEATLARALQEGSYALDYRIVRPDGQLRWLREEGRVRVDADGQPCQLVGLVLDVTGEAQHQEERERFFRLAPDLFCVADLEGYFRRINPAFSRTLGWSEQELLRQPFFALVHPEDQEATHAELRRLAQGQTTTAFENRYRGKDGHYRWLAWRASPAPELGLVYAAARDITETRRLEAEARTRADFEQKLIGIVSHDLRNPLGAIQLGTQVLLRRADLAPEAQATLHRIGSSTGRCIRLVRDLLDFTRARLGQGIPVHPRPADLERLVHQALEEVGAGAPGRAFRVSVEGDPRGTWDPDRLLQVLGNLLTNAVRYSPEGTPIHITLGASEPHTVRLEVHNTGEPIPEPLQARLFEPLQRGPHAADPQERSVGLGLYIVQHLVQAHGGDVTVRSGRDTGTRFTVSLPRVSRPTPR